MSYFNVENLLYSGIKII